MEQSEWDCGSNIDCPALALQADAGYFYKKQIYFAIFVNHQVEEFCIINLIELHSNTHYGILWAKRIHKGISL